MIRSETLLLYGETGSGKTCQIGRMAEWEFARTGRITRLISADSGWAPIEDLIDKGIVEAWNVQLLPNPFPVFTKLADGYWPKVSGGKRVLAPPTYKDGWMVSGDREVGQYAIEGTTTISDALMQDHIRNQRKIAMDLAAAFSQQVEVELDGKVTTASVTFGKAGMAHYGQVQDFVLLDLVPRFSILPVSRVIWTGHEAKGDDDISGIKNSVLGPATIGKAGVVRTAKKFGDTFHFVKLAQLTPAAPGKPASVQIERRAYYEDHPDDVLTKILWPAKLSLPINRVRDLRAAFPNSYVPLTLESGMEKFLDFKYGGSSK